jgi:hypothetical protein
MLEILRHAAGQDDTPITAATGLRSSVEDRWRDASKAAGKPADLTDIRAIDPDLVERELTRQLSWRSDSVRLPVRLVRRGW